MIMAIEITINGELRLDQSSGTQDDDIDIDNTLTGLNTNFRTALLGLAGDLLLSQAQKDFAADVNGASQANYVTVASDGETVNDLFFSDTDGNLFNGDQVFINNDPLGDPLQTVNGDDIYLWSLSGNLVIATTSATSGVGDVVAAFYLDEAGDHLSAGVQMVTFIPLGHPDTGSTDETVDWSDLLNISAAGSAAFDFDSLRSGSSLWVAVGSASAGILVSGHHLDIDAAGKKTNASNTIHTSQGGQGATIGVNNQLFDNAGENAVFTLVSGFDNLGGTGGAVGDYVVDPKPNDNKPEGISYDGYLNVSGAGIFLSQSQGNDLKDLTIEVYEAGGGTTAEDGFDYVGTEPSGAFDDDTEVDVKTVTIVDNLGHVVGTWSISPGAGEFASGDTDEGVTVTITDHSIEVDGLKGGYRVNWTVVDGETFNRFHVIADAGQFDIGGVEITQGLVVSEPIGDTMFVDDDGPSLPPATQDVLELTTDDTDVDDPSTDTLSTDLIFTGSPTFGTDGPSLIDPILYSLRIAGADPDPESGLVDTATGKKILLTEDGDDIVGIVDDSGDGTIGGTETTVAVRWSLSVPDPLDLDTETVTFTQYRSVVHDDPTDPEEDGLLGNDEPSTVAGGILFLDQTAIDGDEDPSSVSSFDLGAVSQLWDDGPSIGGVDGEIADSIVDFAAGATDSKSLEGVVGEDLKTSPYTLTDFTASITINGVELHGVADSTTKVTYWADTSGNDIFGDAGDTAYYTMELSQSANGGAGGYTFTVLVDPPPALTEFNFDDLPSGSNLFGIVGDADAGLIIFGEQIGLKADNTYIANQTQEVKTSQAGLHDTIGIESQMFDPGDAAFFTFVNNPDPDFTGLALGSTEADDADNILYGTTLEGDSAFIKIAQTQSGATRKMSIELFNIDDSNPQGVDMINARGTNEAGKDPDVTAVRVYAADGTTLLESFSGGVEAGMTNAITIEVVNGVATVQGFNTNYKIEWDADEDFDQTLITGVSGKWDVGGFGFVQSTATPDQKLDFEATVTDGDGDTDVATWQIGIDGTGSFNDNLVSGVVI